MLPALVLAAIVLAVAQTVTAQTTGEITTYRFDNQRDGQNTSETILTRSNVNPSQFEKLFSDSVDGAVYAEPLYVPGVTVGNAAHNVVYMATENDSVYAFDRAWLDLRYGTLVSSIQPMVSRPLRAARWQPTRQHQGASIFFPNTGLPVRP